MVTLGKLAVMREQLGVVCARVGTTIRHLARKCSGTRQIVVVVRRPKRPR